MDKWSKAGGGPGRPGRCEELLGVWCYSSGKFEDRLLGATAKWWGLGGRQCSIRESLRDVSRGWWGPGQIYTVGVSLCSTAEDRVGEARPKPGRPGRRPLQRESRRESVRL